MIEQPLDRGHAHLKKREKKETEVTGTVDLACKKYADHGVVSQGRAAIWWSACRKQQNLQIAVFCWRLATGFSRLLPSQVRQWPAGKILAHMVLDPDFSLSLSVELPLCSGSCSSHAGVAILLERAT